MGEPINNFTMYECLGHPMKQMMEAWIGGIKDPMTDPKWRRKQRLKKLAKQVASLVKKAFIVAIVWVIVTGMIKLLKDD